MNRRVYQCRAKRWMVLCCRMKSRHHTKSHNIPLNRSKRNFRFNVIWTKSEYTFYFRIWWYNGQQKLNQIYIRNGNVQYGTSELLMKRRRRASGMATEKESGREKNRVNWQIRRREQMKDTWTSTKVSSRQMYTVNAFNNAVIRERESAGDFHVCIEYIYIYTCRWYCAHKHTIMRPTRHHQQPIHAALVLLIVVSPRCSSTIDI